MRQIPIRITSMGPADHGKSTLFGYLVLNQLNSRVYWDEIEKSQKADEWFRPDMMYAYVFDRSLEERRGQCLEGRALDYAGASRITTHVQCEVNGKKYLFIDVPGHEKFLKNTTSGIFQAQSGVLVVAAPDIENIIQLFKKKENNPKEHSILRSTSYTKVSNVLHNPISSLKDVANIGHLLCDFYIECFKSL